MDATPRTPIIVHGAGGRMGQRLIDLAMQSPDLDLLAAIDAPGAECIGQDAGIAAAGLEARVKITDHLPENLQSGVIIDFTAPPATRNIIQRCLERSMPLVIGTTGLGDQDHEVIDNAALHIPILQAPNMSLGINLLFALAAQVARRLGNEYDIEIIETHHRHKKDAPSGTALGIARSICNATGKSMDTDVIYGRHGEDVPRLAGQIGVHALRSGDIVGRHTASFATVGEELQLTHIATTRDVFAAGALAAARWLEGKPAGRYRMADVLGLDEPVP